MGYAIVPHPRGQRRGIRHIFVLALMLLFVLGPYVCSVSDCCASFAFRLPSLGAVVVSNKSTYYRPFF